MISNPKKIRRKGTIRIHFRVEIECIAMQKFKIFAYGCACQFRVIAIRIRFNPLHAVSERNISEFIASESIFSNSLHTARKVSFNPPRCSHFAIKAARQCKKAMELSNMRQHDRAEALLMNALGGLRRTPVADRKSVV